MAVTKCHLLFGSSKVGFASAKLRTVLYLGFCVCSFGFWLVLEGKK